MSIISPARFNWPNGLHMAAANAKALAMQVHRGAAMRRDNLAALAEGNSGRVHIDARVFLGKLDDFFAGSAFNDRHAEIFRDRLAPRVENIPMRAPADDG